MEDVTDRAEPIHLPLSIGKGDASTSLFLAGIEQAFNDPNEERLLITIRELQAETGTLDTALRLYESMAEDSAFRWGVVYLMSRIAALGTVDWLARVALQPLADAAPSDQEGCETPRDNEVLVRVMAVEGLGQLVELEGVKAVNDALTAIIANQTDPAIQSAAVVQLLRLEPDAAPRLRSFLPSHRSHFADVELKENPAEVDRRPDSLGLDPGGSPLPPLADEKGR